MPDRLEKSITHEESHILKLKYQSKRFGLMSAEELIKVSRRLLLKIHVITGWVVPEDLHLEILQDQVRKKMIEGYSTVNADEVEYAFRTYGTQVKDWGKQMNLSLIDEVMMPYLIQRSDLSKVEEQKKTLPPPKKEVEPVSNEEFIKSYKGRNTPLDLLPDFLYQWLIDTQRLWTKWDDPANLNEAVAFRKYQIVKGLELNPADRALINEKTAFKQMLAQGFFEGPEIGRIENIAKKILIRNYINEMK